MDGASQDLPALKRSVDRFNPKLTGFDCSVFDGKYVTGPYRHCDAPPCAGVRDG